MSRKAKGAKSAVMRPHFRSRVERDRKKDERSNPNDGHEWVWWYDEAHKLDDHKEHWPDLPLDNIPGDE